MDRIRDAVILIAGVGARLRPLTDRTHKTLLEVGDSPLLQRLLEQLAERGIQRAWLATGYKRRQIADAVDGFEGIPDIEFAHNPDFAETNNAESLRLAMTELERRPFLLCDGDILLHEPDWLDSMLTAPTDNTLAVLSHDNIAQEEMKVILEDGDGAVPGRRVTALSKKLPAEEADAESIGVQTVGADLFAPLLGHLEAMTEAERADAYYEDFFAKLIDEGHRFGVRPIPTSSWTEIDTPEDLENARQLAKEW